MGMGLGSRGGPYVVTPPLWRHCSLHKQNPPGGGDPPSPDAHVCGGPWLSTIYSFHKQVFAKSAALAFFPKNFYRYHKLESIINGSGSSEKHTRDNNGPATSERLTKLEHLSKTYAVRTCFELKSMGVVISGRYFLDPDGSASGHGPKDPPVEVYCDMTTGQYLAFF